MLIASYVFFGLFVLTSIIHLVWCFLKKEKLRKISKVFCIGLLSISLILRAPNYPLIYIGAIFGTIGDYFLIKKEKLRSLVMGIISFFIGHVFYAIQILMLMSTPTWGFILYFVLEITLEAVLCLVLYPRMKFLAHGATAPGIAYFTMLGSNLVLAIILGAITKAWIGPLILGIGYLIFIISDTILLYTAYIKQWKRDDFYIMLTYISAELLITCSLVFMVIA